MGRAESWCTLIDVIEERVSILSLILHRRTQHAPIFQRNDLIDLLHAHAVMRDDQHRPIGHERLQRLHDLPLRHRVEVGRRFVGVVKPYRLRGTECPETSIVC